MRGINKLSLISNLLSVKRFLLLEILVLLQIGCSQRLTPEEYIKYYEKNKIKYSTTIERRGVKVIICYQPQELFAAREILSNASLTADSVLKMYEKSMFLTYSVIRGNGEGSPLLEREGMEGFSRNVFKQTYGKKDKIFLCSDNDTIKPVDYLYERNWGIGNEDSFLLLFKNEERKRNFKKYHLIIREVIPEIGTIDIELKDILKRSKKLRK